MKSYLLVLVLVSAVFCQDNLGFPATPGQFPWVVSIVQMSVIIGNETICSGSIISNTWVMTVASCNDFHDITLTYRLSFGGIDLDNPEIEQRSNQYIPFPYDDSFYNWNMALIQLSTALVFSTTISPIALPTRRNADNEYAASEVTIVGIMQNYGVEGKFVRWNTIKILARDDCNNGSFVHPNEICSTGTELNANQSPCRPTIGYGITTFENGSWVQIGIGSIWNFCSPDRVNMFLLTGKLLNWISTVTAIEIVD